MLDLRRTDNLFTITMNNGENRFSLPMLKQFESCLDQVQQQTADGPGALLITGQGKYWSNGIDLEWLSSATPEEQVAFLPALHHLLGRLVSLPMPTVAAINGHVFAGGGLLAVAADYRVMREDRGWFCLPEVDIQVMFSDPMISLLASKLTATTLRDATLSGRRYTGPEALAAQIADATAAEAEVLGASAALVAPLADKGRGIFRQMKTALYGKLAAELGYEPSTNS